MKSTTTATLVLALSTLVAGQAMAGNIDTSNPSELDFVTNVTSQPASTKTRAEVLAELAQVKRSNIDTSNFSELDFALNAAQAPVSTLTRAQVRAEAAQVKRSNIDLSNPSELDFAFNANKAAVAVRADIAEAQVEPAPVEFAQAN